MNSKNACQKSKIIPEPMIIEEKLIILKELKDIWRVQWHKYLKLEV